MAKWQTKTIIYISAFCVHSFTNFAFFFGKDIVKFSAPNCMVVAHGNSIDFLAHELF